MNDVFPVPGYEWKCEGCGTVYGEYTNGCPRCWVDGLEREANYQLYPNRSVRLVPVDGAAKDGLG